MNKRPTLSYDGHGINGPDEGRSRLATFSPSLTPAERDHYGKLFEQAPELLLSLQDTMGFLDVGDVRYVWSCKGESGGLIRVLNTSRALLRKFS
jgi:hypothetical protein